MDEEQLLRSLAARLQSELAKGGAPNAPFPPVQGPSFEENPPTETEGPPYQGPSEGGFPPPQGLETSRPATPPTDTSIVDAGQTAGGIRSVAMEEPPKQASPDLQTLALKGLASKLQGDLAGVPDVPLQGQVGVVANMVRGFNKEFTELLDLPLEAGNQLIGLIGLGNYEPGKRNRYIEHIFNALGTRTDPIDGLSANIGKNTVMALGGLSGLMANAERMAAAKGMNVFSYVARTLGDAIMRHPWLAVASEVGGTAAATTTEELTGSKVAGIAGGIAGGQAGYGASKVAGAVAGKVGELAASAVRGAGSVARAVTEGATNLAGETIGGKTGQFIKDEGQALTENVRNVAGKVPGLLKETPPTGPTEAVRPEGVDPSRIRVFAQNQVEGDQLKIEEGVRKAIEAIPARATAEEAQSKVRAGLEQAERIANGFVERYWQRVPLKAQVPMNSMHQQLDEMAASLADRDAARPDKYIEQLRSLGLPQRNPETGRMLKARLPTVEKLRDIRGQIRRDRLDEQGKGAQGKAPNDELIRNYSQLEGMIDDTIQRALPGDVSIGQARAMSTFYHNLFTRSPVGDAMTVRARGDLSVPAEKTMEALLSKDKGVDSLLSVSRKVADITGPPDIVTRKPFQPITRNMSAMQLAANQQEREQLQQLKTDAENSIRSIFREQANASDPKEAVKLLDKLEPKVKPLGSLAAQLQQTGQRLTALIERDKLLRNSTIARFAQEDPQVAMQRVFSSADPVKEAKVLLSRFKGNSEAMDALRAGAIDEALRRTRLDPGKLRELLDTPRYRDALYTLLSDQATSTTARATPRSMSVLGANPEAAATQEVRNPSIQGPLGPSFRGVSRSPVPAAEGGDTYDRFRKIVTTVNRIVEGGDKSAREHFAPFVERSAQFGGAAAGRFMSHLFGGGTIQIPAMFANIARKYVRDAFKGVDPRELMVRAILDPREEKLLFLKTTKDTKDMRTANALMRRTIGALEGARQGAYADLTDEIKNARYQGGRAIGAGK